MINRRILKLGGSLLLLEDWPRRLQGWLTKHPAQLNLMIVGGGEIVEAVRQLDSCHRLSASFVHWSCIDLLSTTAKVASELLPEFPLVSTLDMLQDVLRAPKIDSLPQTFVVEVAAFYQRNRPLASRDSQYASSVESGLPEDWSTTSDTLAAYLARQVAADELVLLKSIDSPAAHTTPQQLSELGIVDTAFPRVYPVGVALRLVNLATWSA